MIEYLPNGWRIDKVGNFMTEVKDKIDPTESNVTSYIGLEHIQSNGGLIGRGISSDVKSTKTAFKANDVLYGKLRPYLNKHIIVGFDGVCSTDILVYRNPKTHASKLFNYWLNLDSNIQQINSESKGINLPRVSASTINSLDISVPPDGELEKIVGKLDTLFGHLDQLKVRLEKIPDQLQQFRKAVLTRAVTGKLTEEWRKKKMNVLSGFDMTEKLLNDREKKYQLGLKDAISKGLKKPNKPKLIDREVDSHGLPLIPTIHIVTSGLDLSRQFV